MLKLMLCLIPVFAFTLAGCQTIAVNDESTEMQKVVLLAPTAKYLVDNDREAANIIAKNNKYGQKKGWWK